MHFSFIVGTRVTDSLQKGHTSDWIVTEGTHEWLTRHRRNTRVTDSSQKGHTSDWLVTEGTHEWLTRHRRDTRVTDSSQKGHTSDWLVTEGTHEWFTRHRTAANRSLQPWIRRHPPNGRLISAVAFTFSFRATCTNSKQYQQKRKS
jgi:hypothetical protein